MDKNSSTLTKEKYIDLFKITPKKTIEIKDRIAEEQNELIRIFKDDFNYNIIAGLNTGKTYTVIKALCEEKINSIVVVPLQIIAKQKYEEFKKSNPQIKLGLVHGSSRSSNGSIINGISDNEIKKYIKKKYNVYICVYESLERLVTLLGIEKLANFILVVDEAHNLITQYDFRFRGIDYILQIEKLVKKSIYITGTPEGAILNNYQTVKFTPKTNPPKQKISIVQFEKNSLVCVFNHILSLKNTGRVIVVKDSLADLTRIQNALIEKGVKQDEILILSRSHKDNIFYYELLEKEKIPSKIKYLLTTRVISDGANIFNKDIEAVFLVEVSDIWLKRQFIGRFRKGIKSVFDYIEKNDNHVDLHDFISDINKDLDLTRKKFKNEFENKKVHLEPSRFNSTLRRSRGQYIYFDPADGKWKIFEQQIYYTHLYFASKTIYHDKELSYLFYSRYCEYDVDLCEYDDLMKRGVVKNEISSKEFNKICKLSLDFKPDDRQYILDNLPKILSAYLAKNNATFIDTYFMDNELLYPNFNIGEFYLNNERTFTDTTFKKRLKELKELALRGYTKEILIAYLKRCFSKNNCNAPYFLLRLKNFIHFQAIQNFSELIPLLHDIKDLYYYKFIHNVTLLCSNENNFDNKLRKKISKEYSKIFGEDLDKNSIRRFVESIFVLGAGKRKKIGHSTPLINKIRYPMSEKDFAKRYLKKDLVDAEARYRFSEIYLSNLKYDLLKIYNKYKFNDQDEKNEFIKLIDYAFKTDAEQ